LAIVGLVVPGAAFMIGTGIFVGLGALSFWPVFFAAILGAIVGDGVSYWLGHHYRDQLRHVWPFSRHPELLSRAEKFFHRHGGKSVVLARFVGPMRPVIPVVAGMLGMRPQLFYGVNILSALIWAPAHLLPGLAFGTSLALAGVIAERLVALILLLAGTIWLLLWLSRWLYDMLSTRTGKMTGVLLDVGRRHARLNKIVAGLLDPDHPEFKTLSILGVLLIGATWLFFGVLEDVVTGDPLVRADHGVYQFLQDLRTPWADRFMVLMTELGDPVVIGSIVLMVLVWLLWRRNWRAAGYWFAAVGFGQIAATVIKLVMQRPRPVTSLYHGLSTYSFPSGHATMAMVVYGFLAVLVASRLSQPRRWFVYSLTAILIFFIVISRLYLGAHWLSDVLSGMSLGLAWISLLGIAYYRHPTRTGDLKGLQGAVLLTLVLAAGWHASQAYRSDLHRYAPRLSLQYQDAENWRQTGWKILPAYRQDLEGEFEQPLNVQWSGSLPLLHRKLQASGWHDPVEPSRFTILRWLLPSPKLAELPLPPQIHDGRDADLQMVYPLSSNDQGERQLVVRIWRSHVALKPGGEPVWVGNVSYQAIRHFMLLSLPVDDRKYDAALSVLVRTLEQSGLRNVNRIRGSYANRTGWSGALVLAW
jgi:undecaprenyl-diphosphatase